MKAIIVSKPGGYAQLQIQEKELGSLGQHEIHVQVSYIGVNYADCLVRMGLYKSAKELVGFPIVPGFDFSGTVLHVGEGVENFKCGDSVFGITRFGAYQTELIIDEKYVRHIPASLSHAVAATLPTAFLTAYYLVEHMAHLKQGERLLVRSVAGGVGSWLQILGEEKGAIVHGTVSSLTKKKALDSQKRIFLESELDASVFYDVIANAKGGVSIREDMARLKQKGRLVLYGFHGMIHTTTKGKLSMWSWIRLLVQFFTTPRINPFTLVNQNKSVSGFNLSYLFNETKLYTEGMESLLRLIDTGVRIPHVTEIPFEEVGKAHRMLESGTSVGKIVLKVTR